LADKLVSEKPVELGKVIQIAYLVVILSAFAWAKEFLLPLILAILISFLLAPVVSRLERWRFPRAIAVLSVVAIVFALIGVLCSTLSLQALDLVNSLPKYRDNIHAKWAAIQQGPPGPLNLAFSNIGAAIADLSKVTASAEGNQKSEATKVQIVSGADSIVAMVKNSPTPVVGPIGEFAVVVVLYAFRAKTTRPPVSSSDRTFARCVNDPRRGRGRIQIKPLSVGTIAGEHRICITAWARSFSDRYTERTALGSSNPRIAIFALCRSLDICLFPAATIYRHFQQLEGTDTDSGPLRVSGSLH
jgi:AI-2E family transporter